MKPRISVMGGSLGGLTAALSLRDVGCAVDVYERSNRPLIGQGAGIVLNPATVRYFTVHDVLSLNEISGAASWVRYINGDGSLADEKPCAFRFSSYNALYWGLLRFFNMDHYHLGETVIGFDQDQHGVIVKFANGRSEWCDMLVCADGIRSTGRSLLLPEVPLAYAGYIAWRGIIGETDLNPDTFAALREGITYHVMPNSHILIYPVPIFDQTLGLIRPYINWLWYRNVQKGSVLDDLMTDRDGVTREVSLSPGTVQERHIEQLRKDAFSLLPPPFIEVLLRTPQPFLQLIFDCEVPQMAFGRVCLIGDAAFVARPHAAAGTAKAAEDAWKLGETIKKTNGDVVAALKYWEPGQLQLGRNVVARTREAGQRLQFEGTWQVGTPLPFGLYAIGDSSMPDVQKSDPRRSSST